jgi:hypothetical protein
MSFLKGGDLNLSIQNEIKATTKDSGFENFADRR